jgi:hypothetical protein
MTYATMIEDLATPDYDQGNVCRDREFPNWRFRPAAKRDCQGSDETKIQGRRSRNLELGGWPG